MNARKVLVSCALVAGLVATMLEITALGGPPSVEYRPGVNLIYRGVGPNVAPKVTVPTYQPTPCELVYPFYCGWASTAADSSAQNVDPLFHYSLSNNRAPQIRVPACQIIPNTLPFAFKP